MYPRNRRGRPARDPDAPGTAPVFAGDWALVSVLLDLEDDNYVAVRPSGTEPKVKFYMFTYVAAEQLSLLDAAQEEMTERLDAFEKDLKAFADSV